MVWISRKKSRLATQSSTATWLLWVIFLGSWSWEPLVMFSLYRRWINSMCDLSHGWAFFTGVGRDMLKDSNMYGPHRDHSFFQWWVLALLVRSWWSPVSLSSMAHWFFFCSWISQCTKPIIPDIDCNIDGSVYTDPIIYRLMYCLKHHLHVVWLQRIASPHNTVYPSIRHILFVRTWYINFAICAVDRSSTGDPIIHHRLVMVHNLWVMYGSCDPRNEAIARQLEHVTLNACIAQIGSLSFIVQLVMHGWHHCSCFVIYSKLINTCRHMIVCIILQIVIAHHQHMDIMVDLTPHPTWIAPSMCYMWHHSWHWYDEIAVSVSS